MATEPTEILMHARVRFCPDVARSRRRLTDPGIVWTGYDIEADASAGAESERLTGRRGVPTLVIGQRILVEPSTRQLDDALVAGGFGPSE